MADLARLTEVIEPEARALGFELVRVKMMPSEAGDGGEACHAQYLAVGRVRPDEALVQVLRQRSRQHEKNGVGRTDFGGKYGRQPQAAEQYGNAALAVIMTGMGRDGSREIGNIYAEGAITIAQDEESSVVFGMPRVAIEHDYISRVVSLSEVASTINEIVAG